MGSSSKLESIEIADLVIIIKRNKHLLSAYLLLEVRVFDLDNFLFWIPTDRKL
jgi:hypothetical protein